jgi:hypothetical protein
MTQPDPGRDTRVINVKGRSIVVRQLLDAQAILMMREARTLQRDDVDIDRKFKGVERLFNILETAIVQQDDRDYLTDLIVAGQLELRDLMDVVTIFSEEETKPKVRRGRPAKRAS